MKLEYQIKYRDILIFNLMHQFFSLPIQVFYGGLTALVFLQYLPTEDFATGFTEAILMYLLIWLSQFLFIVIYLLFGKNKGLYTRHILTVSDNDFCVETIFAKSHYYWNGLEKVIKRPSFVAIYVNSNAAHILPNRVFSSKIERQQFLALLDKKLHLSKSLT